MSLPKRIWSKLGTTRSVKPKKDISVHVFTASATMIGVCLTVISVISLTSRLKGLSTMGDDLLSVNASIFLISCIFAYASLRTDDRYPQRKEQLELVADFLFLLGLLIIAVVCTIITYELV